MIMTELRKIKLFLEPFPKTVLVRQEAVQIIQTDASRVPFIASHRLDAAAVSTVVFATFLTSQSCVSDAMIGRRRNVISGA
mmetsp:Transcript_36327/g.96576  ORF Transcript_36327/g.96576 Transcript_36327/m.96576 type:complete len:81 (-) Transcript_36327:558-800(-)